MAIMSYNRGGGTASPGLRDSYVCPPRPNDYDTRRPVPEDKEWLQLRRCQKPQHQHCDRF